jgi:C-terminal processing protease CtpA/Prc
MIGRFLAAALLAALALPAQAQAPSAPPAAAERVYSAAELKSDFEALYKGLQEAHYDLYVNTPRAEFDRLYAETLRSIDRPMTKTEAEVAFERFVAHSHIAHARIDFPYKAYDAYAEKGGVVFPLVIRVGGPRVYVDENNSGVAGIARGDEIVALNGKPISYWIERTARNISADTPYMMGSLLEYGFASRLWLELGRVGAFDLQLRKPDGRTVTAHVPARTKAQIKAAKAARPKTAVIDSEAREARLLPGGIGYLHPGPFYNVTPGADMWDATAFKAFIDASFEKFIAAGVTDLIIDVRENPGGDNSFSDPMIAWFADRPFRFFSKFKVKASLQARASNRERLDAHTPGDTISAQYEALYAKAKPGEVVEFDMPWARPREGRRFTARVWLLIDRHSYSNTVTVAALVQDYNFGVILGEETSDMATTYGAMEQFKLPNTGILVGFPKAHIIRPNGEPKPRGVVPDIAIPSPIVAGDKDQVLDQAMTQVLKARATKR